MRSTSTRRVRRWLHRAGAVLAALGLGSALVTACASEEYSAEPSFCDDWCHTLRRTRCDQEPENCVRDCERALPSEACLQHQVLLLECYRNTPPEGLVCVEQGFQGSIRPMPDICRPERDALVGCAEPSVLACIEACRVLDGSAPVLIPEALAADPVAAESCPSSPLPCERLCWAVDGAVDSAGEQDRQELPALGAGADLGVLGAALVSCAQQGAKSCWERTLTAEPAANASWTSLFFECAAPFVSTE